MDTRLSAFRFPFFQFQVLPVACSFSSKFFQFQVLARRSQAERNETGSDIETFWKLFGRSGISLG
ncbi:MAG: hypothetical protein WBQ24_03405 [Xanthobacteraceae bacterium]